ncbi:hypothetical protein Sipo8835_28805 [Streptomyces ipomoeae]|uniref:Uncharacterized protein n=1 Tax=Streptomyces ipomoeae TaxID=103232 RepID=A0AAE8VYD9_9ACTN|nr:hypothetical protein Sipo8835_28805 [Streptomyces ipomoeae]
MRGWAGADRAVPRAPFGWARRPAFTGSPSGWAHTESRRPPHPAHAADAQPHRPRAPHIQADAQPHQPPTPPHPDQHPTPQPPTPPHPSRRPAAPAPGSGPASGVHSRRPRTRHAPPASARIGHRLPLTHRRRHRAGHSLPGTHPWLRRRPLPPRRLPPTATVHGPRPYAATTSVGWRSTSPVPRPAPGPCSVRRVGSCR